MARKTIKQARAYYESIQSHEDRRALLEEFKTSGKETGDTKEQQFYKWLSKHKM